MYKKKLLNKSAFTLIELLIVIAIIGVLFVVLISKVDFATDKAKTSGVQTDFRSFQMAFDIVAKENAGFASLITTDYEKLEATINKNLDTALKIDIDAMGKISMLNDTTDPWKVPYHGEIIIGDDDKDRGAIVMYSNGPNMQFGSKLSITGGIASVATINEEGKDDFAVVSCYSLNSGYGSVLHTNVGFSSSNDVLLNNGSSNVPSIPEEPEYEINEYGFYFDVPYYGVLNGETVGIVFYENEHIDLLQNDEVLESIPSGVYTYEWKYCTAGMYFSENGKTFDLDGFIFSIDMIKTTVSNSKIETVEDLIISIEHSGLVSVSVNGETLSSEHYTVSDNTVVTIKESYIETLSNGMHAFSFAFNDGDVATCSIMIKLTKIYYSNITLNVGETLEMLTFRRYGYNISYDDFMLTEIPDTPSYITLKAVNTGTTEVVFSYYPDSNWVDYEWDDVKHIVYYNITIKNDSNIGGLDGQIYMAGTTYTFEFENADHWLYGVCSVNDVICDDGYGYVKTYIDNDIEISCDGNKFYVCVKSPSTITFSMYIGTPVDNYSIEYTLTFF